MSRGSYGQVAAQRVLHNDNDITIITTTTTTNNNQCNHENNDNDYINK